MPHVLAPATTRPAVVAGVARAPRCIANANLSAAPLYVGIERRQQAKQQQPSGRAGSAGLRARGVGGLASVAKSNPKKEQRPGRSLSQKKGVRVDARLRDTE